MSFITEIFGCPFETAREDITRARKRVQRIIRHTCSVLGHLYICGVCLHCGERESAAECKEQHDDRLVSLRSLVRRLADAGTHLHKLALATSECEPLDTGCIWCRVIAEARAATEGK